MIKYPYTDFHEMNLDWILKTVKDLQEVYKDIPAELQTIVEKWLEDHPDALLKSFYLEPQMFGAIGDGITDDTQAFRDMSAASNINSFIIIPKGDYLLSADVFSDVEVKMNDGVFPDRNFITRKTDNVFFAQSNFMNAKIIPISSGYSIQAFCYDSVHDVYYMGVTDTNDDNQIVYVLDRNLNVLSSVAFAEPGLHLNTLTYVPKTGKLLSIRSGGHDILELNMVTGTISTLVTLPDFNSGMQYDEKLDVYVGINGPAISGTRKWNFRVYDTEWNVIKTGEFENPYGYTTGETPNGYSVYDGLMVHSAFTTSGMEIGTANRVQFLFSVDFFGNVNRVYQEYVNQREFEGVAYNGRQWLTGATLCDGKILVTVIDPDAVFSDSINIINQRCELPIVWDNAYVSNFNGHANINARERKIEFSGFITLQTGLATNTELTLGTIPNAFTPFGTTAVIPAAGGTGNINLVMVNNQLRCVLNTGAGRYVNLGGYYTY